MVPFFPWIRVNCRVRPSPFGMDVPEIRPLMGFPHADRKCRGKQQDNQRNNRQYTSEIPSDVRLLPRFPHMRQSGG